MNNLTEWLEYIQQIKKLNSKKLPTKYKINQYKLNQDNDPSFISNVLDLHGLTQDVAYNKLKDFLVKAYENNLGRVLVITGKGKENNPGVIKLSLPRWLEYTEINQYIRSYSSAGNKHGGEGAVIIQIKSATY